MVYEVVAYPYATQTGWIDIPPNIHEENIEEYIENHFSSIEFDLPDLDYRGTDFEYYRDSNSDIDPKENMVPEEYMPFFQSKE